MTFGERLKSLREDLDLNQSEVAHQLNILPKSLSNYELDLFEPSLSAVSYTHLDVYKRQLVDDVLGMPPYLHKRKGHTIFHLVINSTHEGIRGKKHQCVATSCFH